MPGGGTQAETRPTAQRTQGRRRGWDRASALLLVAALAVAALTFRDYGITWDERDLQTYGERVVDYTVARLHGREPAAPTEFRNLHFYGGLYAAVSAWVAELGFPEYETRHAVNAAVGLVGVAGAWRLARLLGGPTAGFWAALLLLVTPRWWGHMFNNPKDVPFAAATIWALYAVVLAARRLPRVPPRRVAGVGLAAGVAAGIRVGGLVVLGYLAAAMALYAASAPARRRPRALGAMALAFAGALALAWVTMLAAWPWAQAGPLLRPLEALRLMSAFGWNFPVLFAGHSVPATELPRSYPLQYLWITTPEVVGAVLLAGLGVALAAPRRAFAALAPGAGPGVALVAFASVFPLAWVMAIDADLYDGLRQLLFVVPPLCVLAGLAAVVAGDALGRAPAALRAAALGALGLGLALHVAGMVRLHPYETVYFNRSVGGLAGAQGRYETDYWGNSYREAALGLQAILDAEPPPARPPRVMLCTRVRPARPLQAGYYLRGVEMTKSRAEADFFLATTRWDCPDSVEGREIFRVERLGVLLAVVKDLRGTPQGAAAP